MMKCTDLKIGRLIARYELGALDDSERKKFVDHLIQCDYCHNEVFEMAPFMNVLRDHREAVQRSQVTRGTMPAVVRWRPLWLRWPVLAAASIVLAIGVGLLTTDLFRGKRESSVAQPSEATAPGSQIAGSTSSRWQNLEIPKAAYAPSRQSLDLRSNEPTSVFGRAMDAYQQDDFATAAAQLEAVIRLESDHVEAHFYRGVSLLLLGKSQEAIGCFNQAAQLTVGEQREASHYYLALAYLKNSQLQEALTELEAVIQMKGLHQIKAQKLKQEILSSGK